MQLLGGLEKQEAFSLGAWAARRHISTQQGRISLMMALVRPLVCVQPGMGSYRVQQ